MWVAAGISIVDARQAARDDGAQVALNFARAFPEEVCNVLRSVEGEINALGTKIRRLDGDFDLYQWGLDNVLVAPGVAQATFYRTGRQSEVQ